MVIIVFDNQRKAIAFWYFCTHWDAPMLDTYQSN
jgi:hypothetical protein